MRSFFVRSGRSVARHAADRRVRPTLLQLEDRLVPAGFNGIGFLDNAEASYASAVSADGQVVVGSLPHTSLHAARWTAAGGLADLGVLPGGVTSQALGVSANGSVVVGTSDTPAGQQAFRWTVGGGLTGLGVLINGHSSDAYDVSADGSVVVGTSSTTSGYYEAYRWTAAGGMAGLGYQVDGTGNSQGRGVSADGTTVTGYGDSHTGGQAFKWTVAGGMAGLGRLATSSTSPNLSYGYRISDDGSTVVGEDDILGDSTQAFRWNAGAGMAGLGYLPGGSRSIANDLSANGSVIVGSGYDVNGVQRAFIWTAARGMRSLKDVLITDLGLGSRLAGWTLTSANGISADGSVIAGDGKDPAGRNEGWVARLNPLPEMGAGAVAGPSSAATDGGGTLTRGAQGSGGGSPPPQPSTVQAPKPLGTPSSVEALRILNDVEHPTDIGSTPAHVAVPSTATEIDATSPTEAIALL